MSPEIKPGVRNKRGAEVFPRRPDHLYPQIPHKTIKQPDIPMLLDNSLEDWTERPEKYLRWSDNILGQLGVKEDVIHQLNVGYTLYIVTKDDLNALNPYVITDEEKELSRESLARRMGFEVKTMEENIPHIENIDTLPRILKSLRSVHQRIANSDWTNNLNFESDREIWRGMRLGIDNLISSDHALQRLGYLREQIEIELADYWKEFIQS